MATTPLHHPGWMCGVNAIPCEFFDGWKQEVVDLFSIQAMRRWGKRRWMYQQMVGKMFFRWMEAITGMIFWRNSLKEYCRSQECMWNGEEGDDGRILIWPMVWLKLYGGCSMGIHCNTPMRPFKKQCFNLPDDAFMFNFSLSQLYFFMSSSQQKQNYIVCYSAFSP